jgi:hypothetical protein
MTKAAKPTPSAAPQRVTPVRSSSQDTATSISEMEDASAANSASRKKAPPMNPPAGMEARPSGRLTKKRLGPDAGSPPTAKTTEKTVRAAIRATSVSAPATMAAERGMSVSRGR